MVNSDSDSFYSSTQFQSFFKISLCSLVLRADAPHFTILAVSDNYLNLVHKQRSEILGKGLFEAFPGSEGDPSEKNSVYSSFIRVIETTKPDELPIFKYEIVADKTGRKETHYWTNLNEPLLDEQGKVAYIINTTTNITEQIRQKQAVEESESRFRLMAEGTDVMIAVGDETGGAIYYNQAWEKYTGRSVTDLMKFGWVDLMHPEDKEPVMKIFTEAFRLQKHWRWEFRMPDQQGGYRWLLARGTPRFRTDGSFAGYISSTVDITEQKVQQERLAKLNNDLLASNEELAATNEELKQTQEHLVSANADLAEKEQVLQMAIQSSGIGTWQAYLATDELFLSDRGKQIHGVPQNASLTLSKWFELIDPADREMVQGKIDDAIQNDTGFIIDYLLHPMDEKVAKWLRTSGTIQFGNDGKPVSILGTIQDITEQKQNEQRKNDFISMVSHELKTPLTSMNGYIQVLQSKAKNNGDELASGMLEKAVKQVGKMTTLINGFLNVSRLESAKIYIDRKRFDMAELVKETEEEILSQISSHKIMFAPIATTIVNADRDKIGQVITNLISNAVKYSPPESNINIACVTHNGKATFSVKDEGMGISKEDLPKLFERYYRAKNAGNQNIAGFGIGLYLCCEIIKRHEGNIWAESELGKGSTFYFTLPISE